GRRGRLALPRPAPADHQPRRLRLGRAGGDDADPLAAPRGEPRGGRRGDRLRARRRRRGRRDAAAERGGAAPGPRGDRSEGGPRPRGALVTETQPRISTPLTDLLGIRHPVIQTGMGYVSDATLTAATSAAGGLGILAGAPMSMAELEAEVAAIKQRTGEPFGVNLRADNPEVGAAIDLLIREKVKVASFALAPKADLNARLKEAGVLVVPSIGAVRHAEKVAAWGADAVVVQGGEGGGHTGPVPTSLLIPAVVDAVDIPVIAAGGYFDGRGLVAALAYGAVGVAMGTRFLLTKESPVADAVKQRYLRAGVTD